MSCRAVQCRVVSCRVVSCRVVSYRIVSYCIALYKRTLLQSNQYTSTRWRHILLQRIELTIICSTCIITGSPMHYVGDTSPDTRRVLTWSLTQHFIVTHCHTPPNHHHMLTTCIITGVHQCSTTHRKHYITYHCR